ncbi:hypothetical protein KZ829_38115 [Actinoplanes hulinensis]|uniref:Uncharacterized protein n=1 Tax=Actinoplanes hulinensis TaxID=1144547 RepID=A0ABS7BF86_9ACTN|nr:hypothetical protein [Actinoplanes hulinensis]MBW6439558.1 hypothetical protein [Actinoplanes hulinensis]
MASIDCETGRVVVHLVVGADGDAEMKVVEQPGRLTSLYYYRLTGADDVTTCLNELTRLLRS